MEAPHQASWQRQQRPHKLSGDEEDCGGNPDPLAHLGNVCSRVYSRLCDAQPLTLICQMDVMVKHSPVKLLLWRKDQTLHSMLVS